MFRDLLTATSRIARGLPDIASAIAASTEEIPRDELHETLSEDAGDDVTIKFTDTNYYAPTPSSVPAIQALGSAQVWLPYRPDRFDCENYAQAVSVLSAFVAGANAVGVVIDWGGNHAYNAIVDSEGELYFYEPQSLRMVELGESERYQFEHALVIF